MKYKGRDFRLNKNIVRMPVNDDRNLRMPYVELGKENYVVFGKVSKLGARKKGAFKTTYSYNEGELQGQRVYAVPIVVSGYSATSMAYGEDGYVYLMHDGNCYQSVAKIRKS